MADFPRIEQVHDNRPLPFRLVYVEGGNIRAHFFPTLKEARAALKEHVQYVSDHTWREVLADE